MKTFDLMTVGIVLGVGLAIGVAIVHSSARILLLTLFIVIFLSPALMFYLYEYLEYGSTPFLKEFVVLMGLSVGLPTAFVAVIGLIGVYEDWKMRKSAPTLFDEDDPSPQAPREEN